ncbi:MAG: hypothetical protein DRR11_13820 [Gammaproteobacteria bacterium]|nr:MAG: hypothetical protein DRR11_13820 [Gammaproteobacteria bacterium]RLA33400.1 MAG: hypothetical protein DRR15_10405 [Gammaproteobacteria bacterium]
MGRTFRILAVCVLLVPTHSLSNQNDNPGTSKPEDTAHTEDRLSRQIPDGLLFMQILDLVRRLGSSADESAVELVQSEMGLDENEARDFIYLMTSTRRFIETETEGVEERTACKSGVPVATGEEVYRVLDAIFDEMANIAAKHLHLLKKNIGPEKATRLQQWLERQEPTASYAKLDYKERFERHGIDPDTILAHVCGTDAGPR